MASTDVEDGEAIGAMRLADEANRARWDEEASQDALGILRRKR